MTLPTPKDVANELILAGPLTAEMFFRDGKCTANSSNLPFGHLTKNYYHAHNLADDFGEVTMSYLESVRDEVFNGVINDVVTSPDFLDILRGVAKEHGLAMEDFPMEYDKGLLKFRLTPSEGALAAAAKLGEVLSNLHKAILVAYHGPRVKADGLDELASCLVAALDYVVLTDDMDEFIGVDVDDEHGGVPAYDQLFSS